MRRFVVLTALIMVLAAMPAQANIGFNGVWAGAGIVSPESPWDMGFNVTAYADLGEIMPNMLLLPTVGYWSSSYSEFGFDLGLSNFAVGADVNYFVMQKGTEVGPYVGGGLSMNFMSIDYPVVTNFFTGQTGTESQSETKFGIKLKGGYAMKVGSMVGFAELGYNLISDFNTLQITGGVAFPIK
jgi:hypothetical protein